MQIRQLAQKYGLTESVVSRIFHSNRGIAKGVKIGGRWDIDEESIVPLFEDEIALRKKIEKFLSTAEAARIAGVKAAMVSKLCQAGKLNAVKFKNSWHIDPASAAQYARERVGSGGYERKPQHKQETSSDELKARISRARANMVARRRLLPKDIEPGTLESKEFWRSLIGGGY